jgi:hypothetical protein
MEGFVRLPDGDSNTMVGCNSRLLLEWFVSGVHGWRSDRRFKVEMKISLPQSVEELRAVAHKDLGIPNGSRRLLRFSVRPWH